MLSASEDFKAALRYSHRALTRAVLMQPGDTHGFEDFATLSVSSGSLTIDGTRNVWRSGQLGIVPNSSVDRAVLGRIDSTTRIRLERGIRYPDDTEEWVTIGLMQTQDNNLDMMAAEVSINVSDLGSLVADFNLTLPYVPQDMAGTKLTTIEAIKDLVSAAIVWDDIPGWDVDPTLDATIKPADATVFTGSRWTAIQTLSESIGAVTYAQPNGRWAIRSTVADMDHPVATYETGRVGTITKMSLARSRASQYNAIPLRWETPDIGGLVFIVDADPDSPTFWDGPFGRKPRDEETNDLVKTEAQAIEAARALLDQYRGRSSSLSFSAVHDPLLEPLDVILVSGGGSYMDNQTHIVDSINYPLAGGIMSVQTRLLRLAGGGVL